VAIPTSFCNYLLRDRSGCHANIARGLAAICSRCVGGNRYVADKCSLAQRASNYCSNTNYLIGQRLGPRVFRYEDSFFFNKKHLKYTQDFYEKHGGKTIIIARFMPIIRTFAPFIAGIGNMQYRRFALFNVVGGIAWVVIFLYGGYFLGNLPVVKRNFHIIIVAIIIISVLPAVIEAWRVQVAKKREKVS